MRVAILGAGAIAYGAAAYLCKAGHDPVLWSPSGKRTRELAGGAPLVATGAVEGQFTPRVAATCAEAIAGAQAVLVALPGNGHRAVFEAAALCLCDGQVVMISSHGSFGALVLSRRLAERGVGCPIVAWSTTVTTGRQISPTGVRVGNLRAKVDAAVLPVAKTDTGLAVCRTLFGDRFNARADLLAIALSNLNPQNHLGIVLCNLTRMEQAETWNQTAYTTPAVGRLLEALDSERLAIAAAFGHRVRTIAEHYSLSFGVAPGPVGDMAGRMVERGDATLGPATLDTRYIGEDVPFGLFPTVLLGRLAERPARLHDAGIDILSALLGRDFRRENDLLPELGLERLTVPALQTLCRDGWPG